MRAESYPPADIIFSSPMKRCQETAAIIYPTHKKEGIYVIPDLRETDFGDFEGKNFEELKNHLDYQCWINSNGEITTAGQESRKEVQRRVISAFRQCVEIIIEKQAKTAAFILHGGTIMTIMDYFIKPKHDFYHWQVKNGSGYRIKIEEKDWLSGREYLIPDQKL